MSHTPATPSSQHFSPIGTSTWGFGCWPRWLSPGAQLPGEPLLLTSSPLNKAFLLPKPAVFARDSLEAAPKPRAGRGPTLVLGSPGALAAAAAPFAEGRQPHGTGWHGCKEQTGLALDTDTRQGCCLAEVCRFACGFCHCSAWSSSLPALWSHWKGPEVQQECSLLSCSSFENSQPGAKSEGRYCFSRARVNDASLHISYQKSFK